MLRFALGIPTGGARFIALRWRIQRSRSKHDERELFVQLTAEGRALKRIAKAVPLSLLARSPLPIGELVQLRSQLQRLRELLRADGAAAST